MSELKTFIDLFAGIGGFRLGLEAHNLTCIDSYEIDKFARQTYQANFGDMPKGDIRKYNNFPKADIITAGFPCQPFSQIGILDGDKFPIGNLFYEIVRVAKISDPELLLLENVPNLMSIDNGRIIRIFIQELRNINYICSIHSVNANNYVPQNRNRLFIIAHKITYIKLNLNYKRTQDVKDIIDDYNDNLTVSEICKQRVLKKHGSFGHFLLDFEINKTCPTILSHYHKEPDIVLKHDKKYRRLSPREIARIMGFPDTFKIVCSDTQAYKQFGNAVVPPVIEDIMKSILQQI